MDRHRRQRLQPRHRPRRGCRRARRLAARARLSGQGRGRAFGLGPRPPDRAAGGQGHAPLPPARRRLARARSPRFVLRVHHPRHRPRHRPPRPALRQRQRHRHLRGDPRGMTMTMLRSLDPATGAIVWEGPAAAPAQAVAAVAAARAAFPAWAATPPETRVAHARAYAATLADRRDALAQTIARETGKPRWEALSEVATMIAKVEVSIAAQAQRAATREEPTAFGAAVLRHRPHGVMAVLGPFNFPGHLPNGHIVPALLAGNSVVFKPSELTAATGEAMVAAWHDSGLPANVLHCLQGARETGAALVAADIDGLLFTGSAAAGAHFRRAFADRPNVITALELGGNNPLILWDGDAMEAAAVAVQSAYVTTGQRCSCARRLIVPQGRAGDAFVDAIAALADTLRIGAWDEEPAPYCGPLISDAAAASARAAFAALPGTVILPLGNIPGRRGAFVTPALVDVTGHATPDEEIFAPVLQVTRVGRFDEAIAVANATRFGLSAGVVTQDDDLWRQFLAQSRAGIANRNRPTTGASGTMPFGGTGESGNHRPSAFYAADYCAYPVASFEAATPAGNAAALTGHTR
ncbi:MAG: succinylglutamate-semialdehyde dehydrogenase [Sphingomonadales bacterium]|nr:succinylglutamate-semialdehyde dehydrogenase [Sphingomonadales bacterium]